MPVLCLPLIAIEVTEELSSRNVASDTAPAVAAKPVVNWAPATRPRATPKPAVAPGSREATDNHKAPPSPNPLGEYIPAALVIFAARISAPRTFPFGVERRPSIKAPVPNPVPPSVTLPMNDAATTSVPTGDPFAAANSAFVCIDELLF